jgi:hypothetical protein
VMLLGVLGVRNADHGFDAWPPPLDREV